MWLKLGFFTEIHNWSKSAAWREADEENPLAAEIASGKW